MSFKEIACKDLNFNPFTCMSPDAVLITAPDGDSVNPMTAAWGSFVFWRHWLVAVGPDLGFGRPAAGALTARLGP